MAVVRGLRRPVASRRAALGHRGICPARISVVMTLCLTVLACAGPAGRNPWPAAGTASGAVAAGKPAPPVRLALAFRPESPRRGEEVDLELTLHALADLPRVRVKLR